MFCMQCGTQIPDRAKFCPKCGASQEGAPEAAGAGGQLQEEMLLMQGAGQVIKSAILANTGEVVLTTLSRQGMPLIRYRTGDVSRLLPDPCPCGSILPRLDRVQSRPQRKKFDRPGNISF